MTQIGYVEWQGYAEPLAFLGNSLLSTMRRTPQVGLHADFWSRFPTFGSEDVVAACGRMESCVALLGEADDPVSEVSAEYARLFVGPPKPAAAPWETFYRDGGVEVGFGKPTFEMRELLRAAGLELNNANNQYEDHMGIELLFLSVLCSRVAQGGPPDGASAEPQDVLGFLEAHPLAWIDDFRTAVAADSPDGYYDCLLGVAQGLLAYIHSELLQ